MEMMRAVGEKKIYVDENIKSMLMDKFNVVKKKCIENRQHFFNYRPIFQISIGKGLFCLVLVEHEYNVVYLTCRRSLPMRQRLL